MSKFNTKVTNKTTNLAGGKAFSMNPEMELTHAVLTTFLENKFYENGDERVKRIKNLIKQVSPEFVAKLAYVARTEFNLRSVTHVVNIPGMLIGSLFSFFAFGFCLRMLVSGLIDDFHSI